MSTGVADLIGDAGVRVANVARRSGFDTAADRAVRNGARLHELAQKSASSGRLFSTSPVILATKVNANY